MLSLKGRKVRWEMLDKRDRQEDRKAISNMVKIGLPLLGVVALAIFIIALVTRDPPPPPPSPYTDISKIQNSPRKYAGKPVSIRGRVVEVIKLPFSDKGFYKVKDHTAAVWVSSTVRAPERGGKVTAKGIVKWVKIPIIDDAFLIEETALYSPTTIRVEK